MQRVIYTKIALCKFIICFSKIFLLLPALAIFLQCSNQDDYFSEVFAPFTDIPLVEYQSISDGDTDVGLLPEIVITFSEPMHFRSIKKNLFFREDNITDVTCDVTMDSDLKKLTVKPTNFLKNNGVYSILIKKDARFSDGAVKNIKIPIDNKGNTLLDFPSESKYSFIRYSAHYFLDDKNIDKLGSELKGNIVILSENDAFNSKYYSTPYDNFFQLSGVHSVLINSILNEKFIYNPSYFIYFLVYIIIIISYSVFARYCNINKLIISSIIMIFAIIIFSLSLFVLFNIYFDIFIIVVTIEISTALLTLYKYSNVKFNNLLLYIATHDIKNDVYSVVMNSKIIKSIKELDGTTRTKLIEEITNSSGRVYDFIERITLLLKLGCGKFASNMRSTNLFEIISQIRSKYENITTDKKLKIEVFGDKNISVLGDKDIILEIFDNLISNAVKYSQNGGVIEITINTEKKYASVSIKDGGLGLDNYEKKKLFKEFYITKNNNDSGVKRVGLGLYITKNLVRLSKGRISVNSEKGKGSVFIVYLPKEIMRSIKILQKKAPEYDRIY